MKLRNEWMTDNEYFGDDYPNNLLLESAVARFEIQRDSSLEGKNATVDGTSERIVVQNHTNPLNQVKYDKKTHYNMSSLVHTGSVVEFDNKTWLVVSKIFDNLAYKTASVLECTHTLSLYKGGILSQIPMCVESGIRLYQLGTEENKYLEVPSTVMTARIPNTDITRQITRGDIYQIGLQNYVVNDINDALEPGLLILKFEYSQEQQETHVYTIEITNGSAVDIQQGTTLQLHINFYDNGSLTPSPSLTFTSSDTDVCTVDSSGLVTALDEIDSCTITVALSSDGSVSDSININVIAVPQDNITYSILGADEIISGWSETYVAKKYNNGIEVTSEFTFSIVSGSSVCTITVVDDVTCSILANDAPYVIKLRATDVNDNTKFVEKNITLSELF